MSAGTPRPPSGAAGRRRAVALLGVALVLAAILATALGGVRPSGAAEKVLFKLDFPPVGYHAIFYAALGRGLYAKNGLEVDIIPGAGSHAAVMDVAADNVDLAFADTSTFALAALTSGVKNVKIAGMVFEVTPYTVLYLKNRGIRSPRDLAGRTLATFQGSGPRRLYRVFARANGVDTSQNKEVISSAPTFLNALVVGQADFAPTTTNLLPVLQEPARQAGNELGEFRFVDHGVDIYGAALLASAQRLRQRPDVVKRFVAATLESVHFAAANPEQALDHLLQKNPQLKRAQALSDLKVILGTSIPRAQKVADPRQLGWVDDGKMRRTIEAVREAYEVKESVDATTLYTNEYVARP